MGRDVLLAAPTGCAPPSVCYEVIGSEAKTIHGMLEWKDRGFQKHEELPLKADFLIVEECFILDISLTAAVLKAVPEHCQVLYIEDADQLPSIGAGNVLHDLIASKTLSCFRLTKVFRQAQESSIIQYAHQINSGIIRPVPSPFKNPKSWKDGTDCLFLDSDEATQE